MLYVRSDVASLDKCSLALGTNTVGVRKGVGYNVSLSRECIRSSIRCRECYLQFQSKYKKYFVDVHEMNHDS